MVPFFDATQTLVSKCTFYIYEVRVAARYDNEMSYTAS